MGARIRGELGSEGSRSGSWDPRGHYDGKLRGDSTALYTRCQAVFEELYLTLDRLYPAQYGRASANVITVVMPLHTACWEHLKGQSATA